MKTAELSIAYFITPHGYGHAARASAVMLALRRFIPRVHFDLFTETPDWFFASTMESGYTYHHFTSDVGLVQTSPFEEDLPATLKKLEWILASEEDHLDFAVRTLRKRNCRLVMCDISPWGIMAARRAGIPSMLIENFTWDFIYAGYQDLEPDLHEIGMKLRDVFSKADYHIQTRPVCQRIERVLQVEPVSRLPKTGREETRKRLRIAENDPVILVTQGGIETAIEGTGVLKDFRGIRFILPGAADAIEWDNNLIRLPHHSEFYTPDLVYASDAVIGKLGYGTVAEVYQAGLPFGYLPREKFPETRPMADFVQAEMKAIEFPYSDFMLGRWGDLPERLLALPRIRRSNRNGADQIAEFIVQMIDR